MKLVVFDMDGTLLKGRTILFLAEEFGFLKEANKILAEEGPKLLVSRKLAGCLKGINVTDFMKVIRHIPLAEGIHDTIVELRKVGHKTAIVTDSYTIVAEYLRERLGMDSAVGNKLIVDEEGVITGEIKFPGGCPTVENCNHPSICKAKVLKKLAREFGVYPKDTVAVGDNAIDVCMIKEAGLGIAFQPKVDELRDAADIVVETGDMREILQHITD